MNRNRLLVSAGAIIVVALLAWVVVTRLRGGEEDADASPTALITIAQARAQAIQDTITVYGVVQGDPADAVTVAAPRAIIVTRMLVRAGQTVRAGEPLVEISNAPTSELAYRQAEDAARFAALDLARVQRLYDERLAGGDQLSASKKIVADAQAALAALRKQGADHPTQMLTAPEAGVVTAVSAAAGDHVPQDAALVALSRETGVVAKLGLEPPIGRFASGQPVTIRSVAGGTPIRTALSMVGRSADQATKTIDAIAPLKGSGLPLGSAVQADIATGTHLGLLVPRAAVVFDETGPHVFVVADDKAKRLFVEVGADNGDSIEVKGLANGARVAVEGAYELQDGMPVKVRAQ